LDYDLFPHLKAASTCPQCTQSLHAAYRASHPTLDPTNRPQPTVRLTPPLVPYTLTAWRPRTDVNDRQCPKVGGILDNNVRMELGHCVVIHKEVRTLHMNCRSVTNMEMWQETKRRDRVPAEVAMTKSVSSSTVANVIKSNV